MGALKIVVWGIMLTPLAMLLVLFLVAPGTGVVALGFVLAAAGLYIGACYLNSRSRRVCPACNVKKLKCINAFLVNPPPDWSFHRCENCGKEFVEVDGEPELVEREKSPFQDSDGWDAT